MGPGSRLSTSGASGTTVSHVSDVVGWGMVYAVGSPTVAVVTWWRCWRHTNCPIIEDARHPVKYRMLVPMVDSSSDVAQPDQSILALNAQYFTKNGGHYVIIKANCIDSTMEAAVVFAAEVDS